MTVIKSTDVPDRAMRFNFADIAVQGKAIIAQAQRQAEQIVAEARATAGQAQADAREQGRLEGFAAGQEAGRTAAHEEAARLFERDVARAGRTLNEAIEQLAARRGQMLAGARQDLVGLALAIAEKVVRARIAADPRACLRTVESAVDLVGRASRLSVRVNPADLATIQEFASQLAARLTAGADAQVVADPQIEPGGCKLLAWRETGQSSDIDASIQTQLSRLANELLGKSD